MFATMQRRNSQAELTTVPLDPDDYSDPKPDRPPVPPDRRPVRPIEDPPPGPGRDVPEPPVEDPRQEKPRKL